MKDFAAIDFETANQERTSVCSIGVVIVRDGKIVEQFYRLVKPYPNFYTYWASQCHGLTDRDTCDAPIFPLVWEEISQRLDGLTLIAHNKSFDEGCLKKCHEHYAMFYPNYPFLCTMQASRKLFGKSLPNHQLHTVSAHCGYILDDHHHALADAVACAHIAMHLDMP